MNTEERARIAALEYRLDLLTKDSLTHLRRIAELQVALDRLVTRTLPLVASRVQAAQP